MKVMSVNYSENPSGIETHYHNCHQLIFVKKGAVSVTVGGREYLAEDGTLIILSRFEEHSIKLKSEFYERYYINISSESSEALRDNKILSSVLVNRPESFENMVNLAHCPEVFEKLFDNMEKEYREKNIMHKDALDLMLRMILINLYRIYPSFFLESTGENTSLIYKIQKDIENNFKDDLSLDEISDKYHISKFHLARMFKRVTGYSPIDYLINCRLSEAKKYLYTTTLPIKQIIDICGFSDESNFSRMFKKKTGFTPSEYRKKTS